MPDGEVQLKISANAGTAVAEMRKVETATAKSAAAAKRLAEANKKAAEQSKMAWRGVEGKAGAFMQGNIGGFGMASIGLTAAVAGLSKILDGLRDEKINATKGEGLTNKELWDKQQATWQEMGKVSQISNSDAKMIVEQSGITGDALESIIDKFKEHKMPVTVSELVELSKAKVTFDKIGVASEKLTDLYIKAKSNNPSDMSPLSLAKVAAYTGEDTPEKVTSIDRSDFNKEITSRMNDLADRTLKATLYDSFAYSLKQSGKESQLAAFEKAVQEQGGKENANIHSIATASSWEYATLNPFKLIEWVKSGEVRSEGYSELNARYKNNLNKYESPVIYEPFYTPKEKKSAEETVAKTMERVVDKLTDKTIKYTSISIQQPQSQDFQKGANK